jgi:hypothetical protein
MWFKFVVLVLDDTASPRCEPEYTVPVFEYPVKGIRTQKRDYSLIKDFEADSVETH